MKWRRNRTYTELGNSPGVLPVDDSLGETPRLVSNLHRRIMLRNELSESAHVLGSLFFRRGVGLGIIVRSNLKYTNWSNTQYLADRKILRTWSWSIPSSEQRATNFKPFARPTQHI